MSVKIVHCGDVHIGATGGIRRLSLRRKKEILQTFLRIISYAEEQKADIILIAGDLFDNHKPSTDFLENIVSGFEKFSGKIFISPGNHDFYGENTFWESWALPDNVKVFKTASESVDIPELGVRIHGGAFDGVYRTSHILGSMKAEDSLINIAVIHGDTALDSPYGPITAEEIQSSNMDYIALGHIHKRTEIIKAGKTAYVYCGCPEGQGFDELYEKGFYIGTVEKGNANMEFVPICRRRFIEETVDISSLVRKSEISENILRKIKEKYGDEGQEWLYKIVLTGETGLLFSSTDIALDLEDSLYYAKVINKTKASQKELDLIANENSVKGIFVRKMLERQASGENIENALKIGLTAFSEGVDFDEN